MHSISCEKAGLSIMSLIDGEIAEEERSELLGHLEGCPTCRDEKESFEQLNRLFREKPFADLPDEVWRGYRQGVLRRMERRIGWFLVITGSLILVGFGFIKFVLAPEISTLVKCGTMVLIIGFVVLFIAVLRERLTFYRYDKYSKEVIR